ncbi:52 kDa repressor of the inhibitor of the protein kinase-like [Rhopalosiphum maidis]|uniref:52 kDa repressor of the inhibitor of the protein kinase-like n=1 Tax=Rhopalosiphum maidis TaxID=43146 RepID=UPI000F000059|nr:52 kDa repressor of the inhibitor of the protein kinase-like [Rhopalosiphum maidis]XP_026822763.1 52 kDa repressor of the inhibitor of the protein kinase-like [Rhopalosiphum maidis]
MAHSDIFKGFESLFSSNTVLTEVEETSFKKLVEFYQLDVENLNILLVELKLWRHKLNRSSNNVPKSALRALIECDANIFPNIFIIIKILCTLPVSITTPKWMFSSLKRIKTYLRNAISEDRLNGLTMLAFHKKIHIDTEEIINKSAKKPRKLDFYLINNRVYGN